MASTGQKIGFIGIGLMGKPMSHNLLQAGYDLMVWNRSAGKCEELVKAGAKEADSLQSIAEHSDILMICVSNTASVQDVTTKLLPYLRANQMIVDFSSIAPDATQQLAAQVAKQGAKWIDSPVSGGVAGAEAGTLAIMAGGEGADVDAVRPVLACLGQRVTYMGPSGSGQTTKICNQMLVSCNVLVMAEVMALAKKAGVDASRIPEALKGGFADSIPLQLTGSRMAVQDFDEVKWHVKTLLKDLDMANTLAQQNGSAVPMAGLGAELMRQHGSQGNLDRDPATCITLYEPEDV